MGQQLLPKVMKHCEKCVFLGDLMQPLRKIILLPCAATLKEAKMVDYVIIRHDIAKKQGAFVC